MSWPTSVALLFVAVTSAGASVLGSRRSARDLRSNGEVEDRYGCKCVFYYQCDDDNYVITNGIGIINIRIKPIENQTRIQCPSATFPNEVICCKVNGSTSSLKPVIKSPDETLPVDKKEKPRCGLQRTILNVRIFTGDDDLSPIDSEFPWIAAVFKRTSSGDYKFHCSGSLIHPKVVLTANHCVHRKKSSKFLVIVNGKTNLSGPESAPEDTRNVSEIINHPRYNSGTLFNDVALLILEEPFVTVNKKRINTLCLPPSNVNLEDTNCLVAGWGKDNTGQSQQNLRKVEVPFVNHSRCQTLLQQTRLGHTFVLDDSFMCAGGQKGRDACKGDGGSPLMCPMPEESDRYFQAGIVAWGIDCGLENIPGVYADVHEAGDWIRKELKERNLKI